MLLLCQQARCEVGKENGAGKGMEAERRGAPSSDAGEKKGAFWAQKIIRHFVKTKEVKISFPGRPYVRPSIYYNTVVKDLGIKTALGGNITFMQCSVACYHRAVDM